jgi:hypothetical protein
MSYSSLSKKSIDFEKLGAWIEGAINAKAADLLSQSLISKGYKFVVFYNSGDYLSYQQNQYAKEDPEANSDVLVSIVNSGGVQDSTTPIELYLQMAHIEFFCREEYRPDMEAIFFSLALDLKSYLDTIDSTACQITMDEQPSFGVRQTMGVDCFSGSFDLDAIVYEGAHFSNRYDLQLDLVKIPFSSVDLARTYETTPDLRKRDSILYFQNTSSMTWHIKALYAKNSETDKLFTDATSAANFNTAYHLSMAEEGGLSYSGDMTASNIQFHWVFGSIVAWEADFVPMLRQ